MYMYLQHVRLAPRFCREDALKRELADITRRSQAAESRHEELATALPEATRPLLRQIEAMQAANAANAQAWAAAERSLHDRLSAAEAHAAASGGFYWFCHHCYMLSSPCGVGTAIDTLMVSPLASRNSLPLVGSTVTCFPVLEK